MEYSNTKLIVLSILSLLIIGLAIFTGKATYRRLKNFSHLVTASTQFAEADPLNIIKKIIPENPIILEAGARWGEDTIRMSKMWPHGLIYAFEPLPSSISTLKENIKDYENILFYPLALNDVSGQATFYVSTNNPGGSTLNKPTGSIVQIYFTEQKSIIVPCITLDDWATANHVSHIDFMWLDMEGHELTVLKSVKSNILDQVKAIYMEVTFSKDWENMSDFNEIQSWMKQHDFRQIYYLEQCPKHQANVIYSRV